MLNPAVVILLLLPWLNPFAPGPLPAIVPLLFSWMCIAVLLGLHAWRPALMAPARLAMAAAFAWLLAGLISSGLGMLQYFGNSGTLAPWVNSTVAGEAFANLRQRNQFASLTNIALIALITLSQQLYKDKKLTPDFSHYFLIALFAGFLSLGNAVSSSRTGMVQLFLVCGLCAVWGGWQLLSTRIALLVAMVSYASACVLLPWLTGFDMSSHGLLARLHAGDEVCASRLTLWSNVTHLILQKPWLGWGWGELDYAHFITSYTGPRFCDILDHAHNLPLHLAVELGVPVALVMSSGFVWWVLKQRPWSETSPNRQLAWTVIALVLLHSLLEYPLWYGPFQIAAGLCLLILHRADSPDASQKPRNENSWAHTLAAPASVFLILFISYTAWDYHRISQIYLAPEARDPAYRSDTLGKIGDSWLFENQVRFAELVLSTVTPENAQRTYDNARVLLHYSPEPRVVEKLIESATFLGQADEAAAYLAQFKAVFPIDHARWATANAKAL